MKSRIVALALMVVLIVFVSSCEFIKDLFEDDDDNNGQQDEQVVDIDGNVYSTVIIGDQEWFAKNLRTSKYNDGNVIPTGHSDSEWSNLSTGAYAIYPHSQIDGLSSDLDVLEAYGGLYNWYAVETGKLCPDAHPRWDSPNDGANDEYGFSALPGGVPMSTMPCASGTGSSATMTIMFSGTSATRKVGFRFVASGIPNEIFLFCSPNK